MITNYTNYVQRSGKIDRMKVYELYCSKDVERKFGLVRFDLSSTPDRLDTTSVVFRLNGTTAALIFSDVGIIFRNKDFKEDNFPGKLRIAGEKSKRTKTKRVLEEKLSLMFKEDKE